MKDPDRPAAGSLDAVGACLKVSRCPLSQAGNSRWKWVISVVFALMSGLSFGAADFAGGLASKRNDAVVVTISMQVTSLALLVFIVTRLAPATLSTPDLLWGALGGLGTAVGLTAFYRALADGPMTTSASITALVGSVVPVAVGLATGHLPNQLTLAGIAVAIPAGIVVSVGGVGSDIANRVLNPRARSHQRLEVDRTRRLSVIAGLGFGVFFVALAQTSPESGLYPLVSARVASVTALALVLAVARRWATPDREDWVLICITGVLDCAANALYLMALEGGSFTWVAAVVSLYPVATVLLARVVLAERIAKTQFAGLAGAAAALVLVGLGAT